MKLCSNFCPVLMPAQISHNLETLGHLVGQRQIMQKCTELYMPTILILVESKSVVSFF